MTSEKCKITNKKHVIIEKKNNYKIRINSNAAISSSRSRRSVAAPHPSIPPAKDKESSQAEKQQIKQGAFVDEMDRVRQGQPCRICDNSCMSFSLFFVENGNCNLKIFTSFVKKKCL